MELGTDGKDQGARLGQDVEAAKKRKERKFYCEKCYCRSSDRVR